MPDEFDMLSFLGAKEPNLKYKTPEEFAKKVSDFFNYCASKDLYVVPTLEQLAKYVGVAYSTLKQYKKRDIYGDIVNRAKDIIRADLGQQALTNQINASVYMFNARNNLDYVDRKDIRYEGQEFNEALNEVLDEDINV